MIEAIYSLIDLLGPICLVLGFVYMVCVAYWVRSQPTGGKRMVEIAGLISKGANAFLRAEYTVVLLFVLLVTALLSGVGYLHPAKAHWGIGPSYLLGALLSMLAGFIGMRMAVISNVRTAESAKKSLSKSFLVAFRGGSVMGVSVVSLALLGVVGVLYAALWLFEARRAFFEADQIRVVIEMVTAFAFGAETVALFARVAGGIYTKAADVGADLVGKTELQIPEDDPRNPATIADNVGDNVGDVAGMGADLFGSYASTLAAAMLVGNQTHGSNFVLMPVCIAAIGLLASLPPLMAAYLPAGSKRVQGVLNFSNVFSVLLSFAGSAALFRYLLEEDLFYTHTQIAALGMFAGLMIHGLTAYFTTASYYPVRWIMKQSLGGGATAVLAGMSVGMISMVMPVLLLLAVVGFSYGLEGFYGIALAATSMMSTTAVQLAIDAFGPIADNGGGIAEMSNLGGDVRSRTDLLDAAGNTTAATGKGFAIGSAVLTSVALYGALPEMMESRINLIDAYVLGGLLLGGMIPFLFSALTIGAVGEAAKQMVLEVRRQFKETSGLLEGKTAPNYARCIQISTYASLYQMWLPTVITLGVPIIVYFVAGKPVLVAYLGGVIVSGVMLAFFQCNAGGAWDNAKKAFEEGALIEGIRYEKKSAPHQAAVIGDTVGDPFKDTSGPSMNILIKLTSIVVLFVLTYM